MKRLLALACVTALAAATASGREATGLVEKVVCTAAPAEAYALFVPPTYEKGKPVPILYVLDARGGALDGMAPFREAAAARGWVVASSWNSASDGPMEPNVLALRAMWNDTHERLSIDDRRAYIAGFSGTARAAVLLARAVPGAFAGIVAAGAGFPPEVAPARGMAFAFFVTAGTRDFNFGEVQTLEPALTAAGIPHRVEEFEGDHDWMPPALGGEAIAWLDLLAMKKGTAPRDTAAIEASWLADLTRARALPPLQARRLYASMATDYAGLHDVGEAVAAEAEIGRSRAWRDAAAARARELREEEETLEAGRRTLSTARSADRAIRDLRIDALRKRTDAAAARVLNALAAQTGFYLPRAMMEKGDFARAAIFLGVASAIVPGNTRILRTLAGAQARSGDKAAALASLRRAVTSGLHDAGILERDANLASLRGDPEFEKIVASVR